MSLRTLASCTLAAGLVAVAHWALPAVAALQVARADVGDADQDSDDDFLPDQIEWACLTSAQAPDTDEDGIRDFVEVVQRANPRRPNSPLPPDHEMRVVVTTNPGLNGSEVTLHLLFRFMGEVTLLNSLDAWAEIGVAQGFHFPLSNFASGPITIQQRLVPGEGLWVRVSAPLVSEAMLRCVLPCTIGADAVIGSRLISAKVPVIDRQGMTCTLVPYGGAGLFAVQSIGSSTQMGSSLGNNRICVLQLTSLGEGSSAYQITGAECQDCNDLVCGADCAASVGSILILPAGAGSITGG